MFRRMVNSAMTCSCALPLRRWLSDASSGTYSGTYSDATYEGLDSLRSTCRGHLIYSIYRFISRTSEPLLLSPAPQDKTVLPSGVNQHLCAGASREISKQQYSSQAAVVVHDFPFPPTRLPSRLRTSDCIPCVLVQKVFSLEKTAQVKIVNSFPPRMDHILYEYDIYLQFRLLYGKFSIHCCCMVYGIIPGRYCDRPITIFVRDNSSSIPTNVSCVAPFYYKILGNIFKAPRLAYSYRCTRTEMHPFIALFVHNRCGTLRRRVLYTVIHSYCCSCSGRHVYTLLLYTILLFSICSSRCP